MLLKSLTVLVVIGTTMALMPPQAKLRTEQGLMNFLLTSRAVTGNSALNEYCFGRYLPILKAVSDQYETDYKRCAENYESECSAIDVGYIVPRDNITATAKQTCISLHNCTKNDRTAEIFECFAETGSVESKKLYSLSADAGKYAGEIRELYRVAQSVSEACCGLAERNYWENTSNTYSDMSACLDGIIKPEDDDVTTEYSNQ